jgi:hypothetical protein
MVKEEHGSKNNRPNRIRVYRNNRIKSVWQDIAWWLVGGLGILTLVLGYIGFRRYYLIIGEDKTGWDTLYRTMQLISAESGYLEGHIPWQLEVARFLLPVVAAYTAARAIVAIFSEQWQLLKLRFIKNHVVICGVGKKGLWLMQEFINNGYQVVVIDKDEKNLLLGQCREQGVVVLIGDATDRSLLCKARAHKAKYLIAVCTDDGTNAKIALHARNLVLWPKVRVLTTFIHIVDLELCNLLRGWGLAAAETDLFRLEFFNVPERGASLMLREHAPFEEDFKAGEKQPHMLIVGLSKLGRSLVVQAARNWWLRNSNNGSRLRISVIDKTAESKVALLCMQYPKLENVCEFDIRQMEKNSPEFERGDFLFDSNGCCDIDVIYICFDDDMHALVQAISLYRKTKQYKVPIIVRISQDAGLVSLINEVQDASDFEQIHVFGLLDRTCNLESLLGGTHEILSQAIHEDYIYHQKEAGATPQTNPSMVNWDALPEDLKESNRYQASHIEVKLKAVNCSIQPLTDWEAASFEFLPEEIELLGKMEHERWCEERRFQGWSYAAGIKNILKKTSPYLIIWEELDNDIKEIDRNMVRGLPSFLSRIGFQIYRRQ